MVATVVSLSLGLFQDFGTPRPDGEPPVDWVEGVTILVSIVIVVLVGSLNDWQKEKQFKVFNEKREERVIKVIRDGEEQMIDIHSIVVGSPSLHTSSLQPPPLPTLSAHSTGSIRFATSKVLRNNNPEEHDGMSSLKLPGPLPPHHRRKGSVATVLSVDSSWAERRYADNQNFRLSPVRSAHSDATSTLPSPTHTHVDVVSDAPSRPSSPASFLGKTFHPVRGSSPSPSGEMDAGSDTARNDGQRKDNSNVKRKGPELARLQSTASLAGGSGVGLPTAFQSSEDVYKASIEDRKRIFGQNVVPQRSSITLLQLMWLALEDKVLVRPMCCTSPNV